MKFTNDFCFETWQFESDTGVQYRCDKWGEYWQRNYGQGWQDVFLYDEEKQCKMAWLEYTKGKTSL